MSVGTLEYFQKFAGFRPLHTQFFKPSCSHTGFLEAKQQSGASQGSDPPHFIEVRPLRDLSKVLIS